MREIKFVGETKYDKGAGWVQHYVATLKPYHKCQGYIMRKVMNHPFANKRSYVPEHRLIMEEHLRRFLTPRLELVHHIDGNRSNNDLSNLKLTSPITHPKEHQPGRRNDNGQFVANDPKFQAEKYRLFNRDTGITQIYTLSELISKTFRRAKFEYRGKWTGLKDKNGKEIYEGDIVKYYAGESIFQILWHNPGWHLAWLDGMVSMPVIHSEFYEVIGNVYENGELLNGK